MNVEYKKLVITWQQPKTSKISLNTFDDKRFYVNNIKSYPHDENLYLFKRDLIKMIRQASVKPLRR